jgi:hypothetical protein
MMFQILDFNPVNAYAYAFMQQWNEESKGDLAVAVLCIHLLISIRFLWLLTEAGRMKHC